MDIPGPAADDDEWSDDEFSGYVDTNQQRGETESGVNIDELGIGGIRHTRVFFLSWLQLFMQ